MTDYDRERLIQVLIYHQRLDIGHCACGWGGRPQHLGLSHAAHIADIYEEEMAFSD